MTKRSEENKPVTTQEQQTEVGQLAYQFHNTNLEQSPLEDTAKIHGYWAMHQIYQEMATAAMTMTEQAQQLINRCTLAKRHVSWKTLENSLILKDGF